MSGVVVVWVGRRAPAPLDALASEYKTRLSGRLEFAEVRVRQAPGRRGDPRRALAAEAKAVREHLRTGDALVALDERGHERTSEELAGWLAARLRLGRIVFVIGSDLGLDASLKNEAVETLALSRLTLPHGLARVLLLEQLYRVTDLWAGGQYHRGGGG